MSYDRQQSKGKYDSQGKGIYEFLGKTVGKLTGEKGLTLPGSNYCGPFNSISPDYIRRNPPTNRADAICLQHDLEYDAASKKKEAGDKVGYDAGIKQADRTMIDSLDKITDKTIGEHVLGGIAGTAIKAKMGLDSITGTGIAAPDPLNIRKISGKGLRARNQREISHLASLL